MKIRSKLLAIVLVSAASLTACEQAGQEVTPTPAPARHVSYAEDVAPILEKNCIECHASGQQGAEATGFQLDSYAALMRGSNYGAVIDPGSAKTSSMFILISAKDHLTVNMPRGRPPLSDADVETIRVWIDNGAEEN